MSSINQPRHWLTQNPQQLLDCHTACSIPKNHCTELGIFFVITLKDQLLTFHKRDAPLGEYVVPSWEMTQAESTDRISDFILAKLRPGIEQNTLQNVQIPEFAFRDPILEIERTSDGSRTMLRAAVSISIDGHYLSNPWVERNYPLWNGYQFTPMSNAPGFRNFDLVRKMVCRIQSYNKDCIAQLSDQAQLDFLGRMISVVRAVKSMEYQVPTGIGAIVQLRGYPQQGVFLAPLDLDDFETVRAKEVSEVRDEVQVRYDVVGWYNARPREVMGVAGVMLIDIPPYLVDNCVEDDGRIRIKDLGDCSTNLNDKLSAYPWQSPID